MTDSDNDESKEPKIIVDTDWKEQVEREKAGLNDEGEETQPEERPAVAADDDGDDELPPPPPASFEVLISMLFSQAMTTLGQMPDPVSGQTSVNKLYAKHYIDTLDMLNEKTEGNRTDDESKMLSEALHALRMVYVNAKSE